MLAYLRCRPVGGESDHVFLRSLAPCPPFADGDGVSSVVRHALQRAGVKAPVKGAHLLRHTAATQMLRSGVPLDQIGLVLRHRSIDTTRYYAKVDVALLRRRPAMAGGASMRAAIDLLGLATYCGLRLEQRADTCWAALPRLPPTAATTHPHAQR